MTKQLFAAVCPTFGHKFAFEAVNEADAQHLINKWNNYHGFRSADLEHAAEEITANQLPGLCISIHNEYIEFLA